MPKIFLGLFAAACLLLPCAARADHQVKVIMKDGRIISGEMLGLDDGILMLEDDAGRSKEIAVSKIKKAFDSSGNPVSLEGKAVKEEPRARERAREDAEPEPAPPRRAKRTRASSGSGARTAGAIMGWSGLVVGLVGAYFYGDGLNTMNVATSTYYKVPYSYYVYNIDGKYYSYSQYQTYYAGQTEMYTGATVCIVGLAVCITGIIVGSSAPRPEVGLLEIQDKELALNLPPLKFDAAQGQARMTLLHAQF